MSLQKIVLWIVAVAALLLGGYAVATKTQMPLGAVPGGQFTELVELLGGSMRGYANSTSTTATTYTLVRRDIINAATGAFYDNVFLSPNTGDITITTMASSSLADILPKAGMSATQCWHNSSTTAGIDITFAGGTGVDFEVASSSVSDGALVKTILADSSACLTFTRKPATASAFDFRVQMTRFAN